MSLHDPGNNTVINEIFVFMSIDEKGRNGITATILPGLGATPMITGSPKIAEQMKGLAEQVSKMTNKPVGMFRFRREAQLWQSDGGKL